MRTLYFARAEWEKLRASCEEGYPREVCGLLFGKVLGPDSSRVERVVVLQNILNGHEDRLAELAAKGAVALPKERMERGGVFEFVIDPEEHYRQVLAAEKSGLDQVGVFHSHPDHPARPSATDESQPFLAGWSNVIAAVHKGKYKEAKSWRRERENISFQEENIIVQ